MKFVTDLSKGVLGTPDSPVLWTEILSHVPDSLLLKPDFKCLVVACGHCTEAVLLVKRMQSLGIPDSRIRDAIWVLDKYPVFTNQARKYGFKNIITADFLQWDSKGMRFDLVMGNPPYQANDGSKRKKLWVHFAKKSISMTSELGYVTMISPNGWKKGSDYFIELRQLLATGLLSTGDANQYFDGIGEDIGFWIFQKNTNQTILKLETSISEKIFEKMKRRNDEIWYYRDFDQAKQCDKYTLSDRKSDVFPVPVYWTASQELYAKPNDVRYFGWKVIVNISGKYPLSIEDTKYIQINNTHAVGLGALAVPVSDYDEGVRVASWLTSKLYRFIIIATKTSGFNSSLFKIKGVNLTRTWTDQELYAHFNLTQEEIEYIESQVK